MPELVRTGLSLERELVDKFDQTIARRGYQSGPRRFAVLFENTWCQRNRTKFSPRLTCTSITTTVSRS